MKHLPLVTKSRAKPPPSRPPPPPNFALYALFAARLDKPTDKPGPRDRKEKVLSSCNSNRNFPSPSRVSSPSSRKRGSRRGSTRTMASTIPLLDSSPIISKCRSSFSPIFSAPNRDPFLLSREKIFRGVEKEGGGCVDRATIKARPITGLPFARRAAFRYNAKTGSISVDSTTS